MSGVDRSPLKTNLARWAAWDGDGRVVLWTQPNLEVLEARRGTSADTYTLTLRHIKTGAETTRRAGPTLTLRRIS